MELRILISLALLCTASICSSGKISDAKSEEVGKDPRALVDELIKNAPSYQESLNRTLLNTAQECVVDEPLKTLIAGYQDDADKIINLFVTGVLKGETYKYLHDLVDLYPIRQSGFKNLEDSIDHMMDKMRELGLENVRGEQVLVPHWVRGEESAELLTPHKKNLPLLGLGTTVGTPAEGITAPVLVVTSFDDLDAKKEEASGKIVVYRQGWLGSYGATNAYRTRGASHASQYGAVATLIQSVGDFSLNTPHTGGQTYWPDVPHIPTACITIEDADFLYRLQEKGHEISIHLKLLDYNLPLTTSRNVIGEIEGATIPAEFVAVSGHIDSWDLGQGAMDDAVHSLNYIDLDCKYYGQGRVMISVMALAAIKKLNLRPKRTLQAILWTSEEVGLWGVVDFAEQHLDILPDYSVVFESDSGTFKPRGLDFAGNEQAGCIVAEVLKLAQAIDATEYARYASVSSDITRLQEEGVPGLSLNNANDRYFWYHHTEADTITMIKSEELDLGAALFAVTSYVLADLPMKLPRDPVK